MEEKKVTETTKEKDASFGLDKEGGTYYDTEVKDNKGTTGYGSDKSKSESIEKAHKDYREKKAS